MARYKTFHYGSGVHYGASAPTEGGDLTWQFLVDWDGDGSYDGANEAAVGHLKNYSLHCGRENYLSSEGNGFDHMSPDTMTLTMDDPERRYDPRNTGSPLSPNVYPGKKCQIAVLDNTVDPRARWPRFTGYIDSITPAAGSNEVTIECKGNLQPIADQELTSKSAHINTTIHDAFVSLLNEAGYQGGIDIDPEPQPIVSFSVDGMSTAQVAGQLADAALGQFFTDRNGIAHFYSRDHLYWGAVEIDESVCLKDFRISQPWDGVFKKVAVKCRKQIREQASVIFYLSNPLEFTGSPLAIDLYPSFESSSDIASGTLEANSQADGKGTNIRTSVTCTLFDVGPMGGHVVLQSSTAGYVTKLEIRGRKWKEVQELFSYDAAAKYSRLFTLDTPWLQDRNYAEAFKGILWPFLDDDRESLVIQIEGRPSLQFSQDLLGTVHFTSDTRDIDDYYWVMGFDEEWKSDTGQLVTTTFYLAKIVVDESEITPANIEDEIIAPLGLDNPTGDPGTIDANGGALASIPIYHNGTLVGNAKELNFLDDA